ncbi:hypothetical protein HNQ96_006362 [Aminobacter lissarensis]|uniref:Uncharacterized protein n=1 Tax=Aminobacter carboxidus TaxID=376165 RepID=A0A8E1WMB1_9HYPH|nr:hypothetical protein [Aminobacter lissarensis]MBB6470464.1 hypothetical protein [Aminobacter lissarensis]
MIERLRLAVTIMKFVILDLVSEQSERRVSRIHAVISPLQHGAACRGHHIRRSRFDDVGRGHLTSRQIERLARLCAVLELRAAVANLLA